MTRRLSLAVGLFAVIVLALSVATPAAASQKQGKGKAAREDRLDGTVQMIDKVSKTVTVRLRGKPMQRQVVYDDKTKFTFRNKPASLDEVKDGRRVICLGKYNDKVQLVATRIDVRDEK